VPTLISLLFRLLFHRKSLPPSKSLAAVYLLTGAPTVFLTRYLEKIGSPRRDPSTGTLLSSGEDLASPGVTEWCFDILYVTCKQRLSLQYSRLSAFDRGLPGWQRTLRRLVLVAVSRGVYDEFYALARYLHSILDSSVCCVQGLQHVCSNVRHQTTLLRVLRGMFMLVSDQSVSVLELILLYKENGAGARRNAEYEQTSTKASKATGARYVRRLAFL
jgi:hypothetical protein